MRRYRMAVYFRSLGCFIAMQLLAMPVAQAQFAFQDTVCMGTTGYYQVNGDAESEYEWWINGEILDCREAGLKYAWPEPGNFILSVRETTKYGCKGQMISGNIYVLPEIISVSLVESCEMYSWNGTVYRTSGTYQAVFQSTSKTGCDSTAILHLYILPKVHSTFNLDDTLCQLQVPPLLPEESNEAVRGSWSPPLIETAVPGTSSYLFTPQPGQCAAPINRQITIAKNPAASFSTSIACAGSPVQFTDQSGLYDKPIINRDWSIIDGTFSIRRTGESFRYTFSSPGIYPVELSITDIHGCSDKSARIIEVSPVPKTDFSIHENEQGSIQLINRSSGATQYLWDFGNGRQSSMESPETSFEMDGTYYIQLIGYNPAGCADTSGFHYELMFKGLFVPNAFSPSSIIPSLQSWKPSGINLYYYHAVIYNRWNEMIWSSDRLTEEGSPLEGWDGTYLGDPCQEGVYTWKITAVFRDGTIWLNQHNEQWALPGASTTGTVTLIR